MPSFMRSAMWPMICATGWRPLMRRAAATMTTRAMLADPELEAVVIATSDAFHVPAALMALQAGKHVLCEKPSGGQH